MSDLSIAKKLSAEGLKNIIVEEIQDMNETDSDQLNEIIKKQNKGYLYKSPYKHLDISEKILFLFFIFSIELI